MTRITPAQSAIVILAMVAVSGAGLLVGRIGGLADGRALVEGCATWCTHIGQSGALVYAGECLCEVAP